MLHEGQFLPEALNLFLSYYVVFQQRCFGFQEPCFTILERFPSSSKSYAYYSSCTALIYLYDDMLLRVSVQLELSL